MVERGNGCAKIQITWGRNEEFGTGDGRINKPKYLPLIEWPNAVSEIVCDWDFRFMMLEFLLVWKSTHSVALWSFR